MLYFDINQVALPGLSPQSRRSRFYVIYGPSEDTHDSSQELLAHGYHYQLAGVHNSGAASKPLRGCEGNPSHCLRIDMDQYLYHGASSLEEVIDSRELLLEPGIYDAAPD